MEEKSSSKLTFSSFFFFAPRYYDGDMHFELSVRFLASSLFLPELKRLISFVSTSSCSPASGESRRPVHSSFSPSSFSPSDPSSSSPSSGPTTYLFADMTFFYLQRALDPRCWFVPISFSPFFSNPRASDPSLDFQLTFSSFPHLPFRNGCT